MELLASGCLLNAEGWLTVEVSTRIIGVIDTPTNKYIGVQAKSRRPMVFVVCATEESEVGTLFRDTDKIPTVIHQYTRRTRGP